MEICTAGGAPGKGRVKQAEGCLKGDVFTDICHEVTQIPALNFALFGDLG